MQGVEQLLITVMYLFWVLVLGILLIAWNPKIKKSAQSAVPVTGHKKGKPAEGGDQAAEEATIGGIEEGK